MTASTAGRTIGIGAGAGEAVLRPLSLESLLIHPDSLPSPPAVVLEVIRRADDPDVKLVELAELIELDAALSVSILRMANSALYSPVSEIKSIERALATLGLRAIRLLVLSTSLRMMIPTGSSTFDISSLRRRMVVSGALARKVCSEVSKPRQDEAFLAGLLTGLGWIVLSEKAPEHCRELMEPRGRWPTVEEERALLGHTADDVTTALIASWGLPNSISRAIASRSEEIVDDASPVDLSLRLAYLAEHVLCGDTPENYLGTFHDHAAQLLSMSAEHANQWLVESESLVADAAQMLEFHLPQAEAHAALVAEAMQRMHNLTPQINARLISGNLQVQELSQRNVELTRAATTDALTEVPNRRAFDVHLEELLQTKGPEQLPTIGLLMIDLDHFKSVNDTHGHGVGDQILREVGTVLRTQTRGADFAARYGGEEFVVVIGDATPETLEAIAERFRAQIAGIEVPIPDGEKLRVTASLGGALFGEETGRDSAKTLLERADKRLYEAKRSGRNRAVVA